MIREMFMGLMTPNGISNRVWDGELIHTSHDMVERKAPAKALTEIRLP